MNCHISKEVLSKLSLITLKILRVKYKILLLKSFRHLLNHYQIVISDKYYAIK